LWEVFFWGGSQFGILLMVLTCVLPLTFFPSLFFISSNMSSSSTHKQKETDTEQAPNTRASTRAKTASSKQKGASKSFFIYPQCHTHYSIQVNRQSARPARRSNASNGCLPRRSTSTKNTPRPFKVLSFFHPTNAWTDPCTRDLWRHRPCAGIRGG